MIVTEQEFLGSQVAHRLNFRHFNLSNIAVIKNGEPMPFHQGFQPDFAGKRYSDSYFGLLHESGKGLNNFNLPVTYDEYDNGYTIFVRATFSFFEFLLVSLSLSRCGT